MRFPPVAAALLLLASCADPAPPPANEAAAATDPTQPAASIGTATSAAEATAIAEQQDSAANRSDSQTPAGAFQWTGRFAASQALCRGGLWEFTNLRVETEGETSCAISDVREAAGKVEVSLTCTAEGTQSDERWTLTPRPGGMSVKRSSGAGSSNVDLLRCS